YVGSLDPTEKMMDRPLVRTLREGLYAEPGYLLFLQNSTLMAQRFDAAKLRLSGEPRGLPEHVATDWIFSGQASFSVSPNGVLAYGEANRRTGTRVVWRDRAGKQLRIIEVPPDSFSPHLSMSEKRLAVMS